jgi:hypothetical protein
MAGPARAARAELRSRVTAKDCITVGVLSIVLPVTAGVMLGVFFGTHRALDVREARWIAGLLASMALAVLGAYCMLFGYFIVP